MNLDFTGKIMTAAIAVTAAITIYACSCSCTESQSTVPDKILRNSNNYIISKVGKDFFDKYIRADFQDTKEINSKYYMVYSFRIPDKPYVDTKIKLTVDTTGRIIDKANITGLPDCLSSPEKCRFNVDEEQAKKIAAENNFRQGIKEWKIKFKWEPKYNQYVWSILSTFEESEGTNGFRGNGEIMLIDPDSGEVISTDPWRVM